MTKELEKELKELAFRSCQECCGFGYNPTGFKDMLFKHGAVKAIKLLIDRHQPSDGFTKLWEERRLDLSAEALILERQKFHQLFTPDELKIARKRLKDYEYELQEKND